jgi:hypothetical protein
VSVRYGCVHRFSRLSARTRATNSPILLLGFRHVKLRLRHDLGLGRGCWRREVECVLTDTSDTVSLESGAIRETVETAAQVTNVLDTRINTG